jgi:hypothetical protein
MYAEFGMSDYSGCGAISFVSMVTLLLLGTASSQL